MHGIKGRFSILKCEKCGLLLLSPQPGSSELKKYYPSKNYYAYNINKSQGVAQKLRSYLFSQYYSQNFFAFIISKFIQNVPAIPNSVINGKVLDLGCGAGDTLLSLKKLGWKAYGLDVDKWAVDNAKKRGLKNVNLGSYKDIRKFPDRFFDSVRLYHVIEHIDNPELCLKLIRKKLKKEGQLLIGTPNSESFLCKLFGSYWYNLDSPRHLYIFSPKTLKTLLVKSGFKNLKVEYCAAGGIPGSIQYFINDLMGVKIDLIHNLFFFLLFYPFEWLSNKIRLGDVFVVRAE